MYLIITEFGEFWTSEKILDSSLKNQFELGGCDILRERDFKYLKPIKNAEHLDSEYIENEENWQSPDQWIE